MYNGIGATQKWRCIVKRKREKEIDGRTGSARRKRKEKKCKI